MSIASLMNLDAEIKRRSEDFDSQGGFSHELLLVARERVRVRPTSPNDQIVGSKEQATVTHIIYCLPSVDIRLNDFIIADGSEFQVMAIQKPSKFTHYELECRQEQET